MIMPTRDGATVLRMLDEIASRASLHLPPDPMHHHACQNMPCTIMVVH